MEEQVGVDANELVDASSVFADAVGLVMLDLRKTGG
jgi:hypothetical protein